MAAIAGAKLLPPPREPGDIAKWAVTALEPKEGGAVRVAELAAPYREWCQANGLEPLDPATFRRLFEGLCQVSGFPVRRGVAVGLARRDEVARVRAYGETVAAEAPRAIKTAGPTAT